MIHVGRNLLHCTVYSESKLVQLAACSITEYSISGVSTAEILRGVGGAPVMDTVRGTVQYVRELPSHRNSEVRVVTCEYVRSTRSRMSIRCGSAMNIVLYVVRGTATYSSYGFLSRASLIRGSSTIGRTRSQLEEFVPHKDL